MSDVNLKGVILDFDSLAPNALNCDQLFNLEGIEWLVYKTTKPDQTLERIKTADVVLTNKVVIDEVLINATENLKYIGVLATGTNNIDLSACAKKGVQVHNVEGYGTASVAQHTLMLMLMLATSANQYQAAIAQGEWVKSPFFCLLDHPVMNLEGKHLVLIGYGELGQAVAKLANAFGMRISVAQRLGQSEPSTFTLNGDSHQRQPLASLLPEADFVSLHCVLTPETEKLINQQRLAIMKSSAYLINTARGGLIDEAALLNALQSGQIGGAGLDVLSQEPPPKDHLLLSASLPNLIVTPHTAWAATEARQRLLDIAVSHVQNFLKHAS